MVDWELSFIIYFDLLFIWLFWFHDPIHEFGKLVRVDLNYFLDLFLIDFFFSFIFNVKFIENLVS
jgi:hypothetical protein